MVRQTKLKLALGGILCLLVLVGGFWYMNQQTKPAPNASQTHSAQDTESEQPATVDEAPPKQQPVSFDKKKHSLNQPESVWIITNKKRPLPDGFVPSDLGVPSVRLRLGASNEQMKFRNIATPALQEVFAAAARDGVTLVFGSGYRSESLQRQFYNGYVASDGQAAADRYSARPGTSEHQTGLSFDATSTSGTCHLEICFQNTPEGKWLAAHAYKFGFVVRYPDGKESVTGYQYEPWHMRYVGKELSAEMKKQSVSTLEEFFGLPAAPNY